MNDFLIDNLIITHSEIRDVEQLLSMISFVKKGGFFTEDVLKKNYKGHSEPKLMSISIFEDGLSYIHDGHHRIGAIYLGGRHFVRQDECIVKNWKYENYQKPNPGSGWVTPFDPRTEVRIADFYSFKEDALQRAKENPESYLKTVEANKSKYIRPRMGHHILDIVPDFC